jgi:hypothetical protein
MQLSVVLQYEQRQVSDISGYIQPRGRYLNHKAGDALERRCFWDPAKHCLVLTVTHLKVISALGLYTLAPLGHQTG